MAPTSADLATLCEILKLVLQRADSYETGVQTTVCWKTATGWLNAITKLEFICKGEKPPGALTYEYRNVAIVRRLLSHTEVAALLKKLVEENSLETGHRPDGLAHEASFSMGGKIRRPHSEWSQWPADVFEIQPGFSGQSWPPDEPLIAVHAPYYPSFEQVLSDFFAIRNQGWTNYLRGQVVVVLPDFRARISKLTIALAYLRADLECVFLQPSDLVVKVYAEGSIGRLAQETIRPDKPYVDLDLTDRPSFVSMALLCEATGETLHEKVFREGVAWREPNVVVETSEPEIDQMLLAGESDTLEFKEVLDKSKRQKLAKTAVAFANTKGGTIVFGVDDDHRVVGCEIKGMSDWITNILWSHCDPPPTCTTRVVGHEGKELLLVQVAESPSTVHVVKELGPFIRANGTNRSPTNHELELLYRQRRGSDLGLPLFLR